MFQRMQLGAVLCCHKDSMNLSMFLYCSAFGLQTSTHWYQFRKKPTFLYPNYY